MTIHEFLAAAGATPVNVNFGTPDWALWLGNPNGIITDEDEIGQCLEIIATTVLGSDPLRPEFPGFDLLPLIDQPLTKVRGRLVAALSQAYATYETRAKIVSIDAAATLEGRLNISVLWQRKDVPTAPVQTSTFALK